MIQERRLTVDDRYRKSAHRMSFHPYGHEWEGRLPRNAGVAWDPALKFVRDQSKYYKNTKYLSPVLKNRNFCSRTIEMSWF